MSKKVLLTILDGWGIGNGTKSDAIATAQPSYFNHLYQTYAHSQLITSGEAVGLPEGQMGNSEVGHLNIGAGRIVYQDLVKINLSIRNNELEQNATLQNAFAYAKKNNCKVHFMGLLSDGGIHSLDQHLYHLVELTEKEGLDNVFIHAFMDGRDCDPNSGIHHINKLTKFLQNKKAKLATIIGRYYAMDRDKRWERIKVAYDMLLHSKGTLTQDAQTAIQNSYNENITDEFIKPIILTNTNNEPLATITPNDVVICFNFRTDRCREITSVLTQTDMPEYDMQTLPLHYVTMTNYDDTFKDVNVIFNKDNLTDTLGEVLAKNHKTQYRIAETEKYPHVTFFFSGGRENLFEHEERILINSPKVATYDLQPEMSAMELAEATKAIITQKTPDFICLNFANTDMVGHTGNYEAVVKAVKTVDKALEIVVETAMKNDYTILITADHGNADNMLNQDGTVNTAHSTNPVPLILIDKDFTKVENGKLADLAPTILKIMNIEKPKLMNGTILI